MYQRATPVVYERVMSTFPARCGFNTGRTPRIPEENFRARESCFCRHSFPQPLRPPRRTQLFSFRGAMPMPARAEVHGGTKDNEARWAGGRFSSTVGPLFSGPGGELNTHAPNRALLKLLITARFDPVCLKTRRSKSLATCVNRDNGLEPG